MDFETATADDMQDRLTAGRTDELRQLTDAIASSGPGPLINLYGIAGIGKSFLLDELQRQARRAGTIVIAISGEPLGVTPQLICKEIMNRVPPASLDAAAADDAEACAAAVAHAARSSRILLILDAYERMEGVDQWLRDHFLGRLYPNAAIVVAGRSPLAEPWMLSSFWRSRILRMPLSELTLEQVEQYAQHSGLTDKASVHRLWRYSKGHPMTLSLLAFLLQQEGQGASSPFADSDSLSYLVEQWLREAPDERLRPMIEAASVLRHFNQECLSFVMDCDIPASDFYSLIRFSFVRKVDRGWTIHRLMREAVNQELAARAPQRCKQLREKGLRYYYGRLKESAASSEFRQREGVELMYYIGDALLRAYLDWFELMPGSFEAVGPHALGELESYLNRRREEAADVRVELYDPTSDRRFQYSLTAEESCLTLAGLDFRTLFALKCDAIRVLRDPSGRIDGLAVVIPIHRGTLPYLKTSLRGGAYFSSLSREQEEQLAVKEHERAGWFIETIDIENFSDSSQLASVGHLLQALIFSDELVVESPVPRPYFRDAHLSLGFEIASCASHTHYDGITPAPTFILDRRGSKLIRYVHRMMQQSGYSIDETAGEPSHADVADVHNPQAPSDRIMERRDITAREKEVAKLLEEGLTNPEIAARLYLSEATVKKHMKSMMAKLSAANRTQLLKKLLKSE